MMDMFVIGPESLTLDVIAEALSGTSGVTKYADRVEVRDSAGNRVLIEPCVGSDLYEDAERRAIVERLPRPNYFWIRFVGRDLLLSILTLAIIDSKIEIETHRGDRYVGTEFVQRWATNPGWNW